ncbi:phospholipase-like protein, partial [Tanacetum coccineum]
MGHDLGSVVDDVFLKMVKNLKVWNDFTWGEHMWRELYAAIRNVNSNHKQAHHKALEINPNFVSTYYLFGFVLCFKIWILESSCVTDRWWSKRSEEIPRGCSFSISRIGVFWATFSPALPIESGGLFGDYLKKLLLKRALNQKHKDSTSANKDVVNDLIYTLDDLFDESLWDSLIGLDDKRLGWLVDDHIELWVWYMWHFRQLCDDWSMVSCCFLTLLLQYSMSLFYATDEIYPLAWRDVFIPINEPRRHWSLAQFHIQSGNVTFYDSQKTYNPKFRPWYVKMRSYLESNLHIVLQQTGVFASKGIDPTSDSIKFTNAQNVPKQGGVFGDCGVFFCLFLY